MVGETRFIDVDRWTLIPEPKHLMLTGGLVGLPFSGRISESTNVGDHGRLFAHQLLEDLQRHAGLHWQLSSQEGNPGFINLVIGKTYETASAAGSYTLDIETDGITIQGADPEGVRNGVQTLRQLIHQCGGALPALSIVDVPVLITRSYRIDTTQGRVPTLEWLKTWADKLCYYKYNQLQLRTEHVASGSEAWGDFHNSDTLTSTDIMELSEYCADRAIELVEAADESDRDVPCVTWGCDTLLPRLADAWNGISSMAKTAQSQRLRGVTIAASGDCWQVRDPRMSVPAMIFGAHCAWKPNSYADETRILIRISLLEYADRTGTTAQLLRTASQAVCFSWNALDECLRASDGEGFDCDSLRETLREIPDSCSAMNEQLKLCALQLSPIVAVGRDGDWPSVLATALRGQMVINQVGVCLAGRSDGCDWRALADELEGWMRVYERQWMQVSRPAGLHHIGQVVWKTHDLLWKHASIV